MASEERSGIVVGCCGLPGRQADYYREFPVVEVQRTFYQLPRLQLAQKWRREAPAGFSFTMKAWQLVTHRCDSPTYRRLREELPGAPGAYGAFQDTHEVWTAWDRTLEWARALHAPIVVFQCPRSFRPTGESIANLQTFFGRAERDGMEFVWEPRGWPYEVVTELCEELDLVHCVDPLIDETQWGRFAYHRLHGLPAYRYRYRYTDEDLERIYGAALAELGAGREMVYVMFNNWWLHDDARRFAARYGAGI
ncbi:MAG TPA: DUF72 domain-containing protein [Actinomycetota bacterium]|nr:DUF72 domain-containing protein [Actinomycetota bacterium]